MADIAIANAGSGSLAAVPELHVPSGPATVFGLVVPIVVDAVERHAGRAMPHVGKERREALPPFAHLDAAAAVVAESMMVGVPAPLPHATPQPIRRHLGQAVSGVSRRSQFADKTTAGRCVSGAEMRDRDFHEVAANAATTPTDAPLWGSVAFLNDGEAAENVSDKIKLFHPLIVRDNAGVCNA